MTTIICDSSAIAEMFPRGSHYIAMASLSLVNYSDDSPDSDVEDVDNNIKQENKSPRTKRSIVEVHSREESNIKRMKSDSTVG